MNYGEKITKLRKKEGMTQAELGAALNVTFQAVSKWERGESLPDFDTMSRMAKLFNVPLSYFTDEGVAATAQVQQKEERQMIGVCHSCGKVVYSGMEAKTYPHIICKDCVARQNQAQAYEKAKQRSEVIHTRNVGLWWSFGINLAIIIAALIGIISSGENIGLGIAGIVVGEIFLYPFVAQLFWDGAVASVTFFGGKTIGMPGVIFDLDLDGIIFLIGVKILFAIIRFIVWLISIIFFGVIGIIIAPFAFIPALIKLNRGEEL